MTDERDELFDEADLIADVTGTLDAAASRRLAARLGVDPVLRARRDRIASLVGEVSRVDDGPPPFAALRGPWTAAESPSLPTAARRRPTAVLAMAAALVLVVGAVVAVRSLRAGGDLAPVTASVLVGAPGEVLALASEATVEARTARIAIQGDGEISFDGAVMFMPGERVTVGVRLGGDGEVRFGGSPADYRLRTSFVGVSGPTVAQPPLTVNEVIRVDGRTYRSDDGIVFDEDEPGATASDGAGTLGLLVFEPDVLGRLGELVSGEVRDLGVVEIDGVEHRHLSFTASSLLFDDATTEPAEIEVWVSADGGTVSRFVVRLDGPLADDDLLDATVRFEMVADVTDLGVDLAISPPG